MERNRRTFEGAQVDEVDLLWDKFALGVGCPFLQHLG